MANDELIRKQDALDALMAEREHLLANGQKGAEHILTHHGYNVIDELPPVQSDVPVINVGDMIYRQAAIDEMAELQGRASTKAEMKCISKAWKRLLKLPSAQPKITLDQAIDYLRETGWLQNHDRILTESKVPLKGTWKDFTDDGYVECPFCKSATNCESKEEISDIHFCFSCGAMLKRGDSDAVD